MSDLTPEELALDAARNEAELERRAAERERLSEQEARNYRRANAAPEPGEQDEDAQVIEDEDTEE